MLINNWEEWEKGWDRIEAAQQNQANLTEKEKEEMVSLIAACFNFEGRMLRFHADCHLSKEETDEMLHHLA